ncbi:MAG: hypothetical protein QXI12_05235 [Candidatus Methanomethyliaceae archaeon]
MSLKEAGESLKERARYLKEEVKTLLSDLPPRPLLNRKTIILKKPLLAVIKERLSRD